MATSKHTPSKWKISGTPKTEIVIHAPKSTYGPICFISSREGNEDECEANARLIAAAPELLEALKELLEDYTTKDFDFIGLSEQIINKAKSAISKAEII